MGSEMCIRDRAWPLFGRGTALTLALSIGLRNLALPLALGAVLDFALPAAIASGITGGLACRWR